MIVEKLSLIGIAISVFTLATLGMKPKKMLPDRLLMAWLVLLVLGMLRILVEDTTMIGLLFHRVYNPIFNLLHGPFLYWYVRTLLTQSRVVFTRKDVVHLVPFVLFYVLSLFTDLPQKMVPNPLSEDTIPLSSNSIMAAYEAVLLHFAVLNVMSFFIYSLLVVYLVIQHQRRISGYFSRKDTRISLTWVYLLPVSFFVITLLNILNESHLLLQGTQPLTLHILSQCCFSILLCFFGVHQKPVFNLEPQWPKTAQEKPKEAEQGAVNEQSIQEKASEPLIEAAEVAVFKEEIDQYMREEKAYLNSDFSVYTLANALTLSRHTISFVLNSGFNKNFYQFVNGYRLEEMKSRLSEADNKDTILDIGLACGFSSKSTYNTLFKKQYGCTPTQYRRQV